MHVDNKRKNILIFGEEPTDGLDDTVTAEGKYPINFTQSGKRLVFCQQYNGSHGFLFLNAKKSISIQRKLSSKRLFTVFR